MTRKPSKRFIQKKYLRERIMSEVHDEGRNPFIVVLDGLKPGFNVAKIFRSANAFGCREVLLVGIDHFDVRAAMGAFRHTKSRRFADFKDCHAYLKAIDYQIFALSPKGQEKLMKVDLPENAAFVFGHEEFGLSFKLEDFPDVIPVRIPQYGTVESLNVSNAATVVMYEYISQFETHFDEVIYEKKTAPLELDETSLLTASAAQLQSLNAAQLQSLDAAKLQSLDAAKLLLEPSV